jgi:hypothetical protein
MSKSSSQFWEQGDIAWHLSTMDILHQNGITKHQNITICSITNVNPVHNAHVCYFNNVWLMFLVFKKNFSFQTTIGPPPPAPVLRISHSDSLPRRAPLPGPSHFALRFFNPSIPPPGPQNPLPPSCLQRWARGNTKPPSQALSLTNWQCKRRPRRHVRDSVSLSVYQGRLNTKTTPCSHGFKIYRPGQTDRLTELIYKIINMSLN